LFLRSIQAIVDGVEYRPACSSGNKKTAKAEAAVACLQQLANLPIFRSPVIPTSTPVFPQTTGNVVRLPRAPLSEPLPVLSTVQPRLVEPQTHFRPPVVAGNFAGASRLIVPSLLRAPFGTNEMVLGSMVAVASSLTDFTEDDIAFDDISPNFAYFADDNTFNMETEYDEDADENPFEEEQFDFDPNELPAELLRPRSFIEESDYVYEREDSEEICEEPFVEPSDNVLPTLEEYVFEANTHPLGFGVRQRFAYAGSFNQSVSDQFAFDINPSPHCVNFRTRLLSNQAGLLGPNTQRLQGRGLEFGFVSPVRFENVQQFVRPAAVIRQPPVRSLMSFPARPVVHRLLFPRNLQ